METREKDEIEITPKMMEAGLNELALFSRADPGEWIVSAIYRAMRRADSGDTGIGDQRRHVVGRI